MLELTCTTQESSQIQRLLACIATDYNTIDSPDFLLKATPLSHELPRRLREMMNEFRLRDDGYGVLVIHGLPVNEDKIGPTPSSWADRLIPSRTLEEEVLLALCGTLLGDLVSWSSEQDGYLVHNVLPIKEFEKTQLGWGSDIDLVCHTEDAFSPYSPDYLALMCMRNPDSTGTAISAVADLDLTKLDLDTLFGDNFVVRPDDAHLEATDKGDNDNAYRSVALSNREEEVKNPTKIAIFFGDRQSPYIRLDPPYMDSNGCVKSQKALDGLVRNLNANKTHCRLRPGDIVFIDNCRVVHGREPFKAKYDGTDRWLKRVKVTHDLRKSRQSRSPATSRKIV